MLPIGIMEEKLLDKNKQELIAVYAAEAITSVKGVAEIATSPDITTLIDADKKKGLKITSSKDGIVIDLWIKVKYGTKIPQTAWNIQTSVINRIKEVLPDAIGKVNVHVVGVTFYDDERK